MSAINTNDIVFLGIVTIIAGFQLGQFAKRVGMTRRKTGVNYPETRGHPDFERIFRAQQNSLEFFPMFMTSLWVAGLFFHQVPASLAGMLYMYARRKYFNGYEKDVKERVPGFKLSVRALYLLATMAWLGIGQILLLKYANFNAKQKLYDLYLEFGDNFELL